MDALEKSNVLVTVKFLLLFVGLLIVLLNKSKPVMVLYEVKQSK